MASQHPASSVRVVMPLVLGVALLACVYMVFFVVPAEARMGDVYRIFYFHVASAMSALLLFFGASLLSAAYLILRRVHGFETLGEKSDRLAWAMAEIGVLFGTVVLVTGPLWAKPAWGTFWTWEPRLTLTLLIVFLFVGYLVLRGYGGAEETGRRLSAGIAIIGAPASWLVHVAVEMWGGNHPVVVSEGGGGLETSAMRITFGATVITVLCFVCYLVYMRYVHHAMVATVDRLYLDLEDLSQTKDVHG